MATSEPRVVGKSLPRMDGAGKVTGTAVYAADFALPGMLVGKVFRSAEPHARIMRLNTARARALPGVRAVMTAADVPDVRYGGALKDETVFARSKVRYVGQPVAAVAATTPEAADTALAAIEVVYESLPAVLDLDAALAPGAPLIHEEWASYTAIPILHRDGNRCNRARIVVGDVERGFEEADRIFEHRFRTGMVHQGYTEPRAAVAAWDSSGQVTVWSNTQLPFEVQNTLAEILQMAPSKIRVVVPGIGGGFGGKLRVGVEHFAAFLAKATGRPVKVMTTSVEELTAAYPRQGTVVELKTGVTKDGRITAKAGRIWFDTGAFAGSGPGVASVATLVLAGPYKIPNLHLEGFAVYTNKTNCGSFRAPSGPQANFAVESQMEVLAEELGVDLADINVVSADTFSTPFDFGAQGSRTAFAVGNACRAAVDDLKRRVFALAAAQLGVSADACHLVDKHVLADGKRISLADLARLSQQTGGGLIAQGTFIAPPTAYDSKRVDGHVYPAFHSPSFHAHAVALSIDPETGDVTIHKYVVAQDVGFAMNPTYIEGQIEGGVAQGLGQALSEEIVHENGRRVNANLTDYKMPTTLDMPRVDTILVQHPSLVGPYGAKGVGEPPNIEPPAAVANAVAAATGLRVTVLPITAERIALGLRDAG